MYLLMMSSFFLSFDISARLDSIGIKRGQIVKLECNAPEKICDEFVLQLYKGGYGVSMEDGGYEVVLGPLKSWKTDSFLFFYSIMGKKDSTFLKSVFWEFDIKTENRSKEGILSGIFFILTGYFLFFVIR